MAGMKRCTADKERSRWPIIVGFNGTKYGYVQNLQGDICQIIDANGTVVVEYTYDAWGKVLNVTGDDNLKNTLGKIQPFRYRGYVYDVETGLYYLRSRYYNSESDRFINGDIILANNTYCYCQNDPVKQKDDQGTLPEDNTTAILMIL